MRPLAHPGWRYRAPAYRYRDPDTAPRSIRPGLDKGRAEIDPAGHFAGECAASENDAAILHDDLAMRHEVMRVPSRQARTQSAVKSVLGLAGRWPSVNACKGSDVMACPGSMKEAGFQ